MSTELPDLRAFIGVWVLERRIEDAFDERQRSFSGKATFSDAADGLAYVETGILTIENAAPMAATRRYLWREGADGIDVFFDDGRRFHRIPSGTHNPEARHYCEPDTYHVIYDLSRWPAWSAVWRVSGPRKQYVMTSNYTRAA